MDVEYTRRQNRILYAFIILSSLLIYLYYYFSLPELHFFSDTFIKWAQVQDLIQKDYKSIACIYPGKAVDPGYEFFTQPYWSLKAGQCYYWFPYLLAYVFAPAFQLLGAHGILLLQHLLSAFILFAMISLARRLGFSYQMNLLALVLFRFGTANLTNLGILEDHIISIAIFVAGLLVILNKGAYVGPGGFIIALATGFRPEIGLMGLFLPVGYGFFIKDNFRDKISDRGGLIARLTPFKEPLTLALGFGLGLFVIFWLNFYLTGHILGLRVEDRRLIGPHTFPARLSGMFEYLIFTKTFFFKGLLFQMPLLLLIPFNLRIKQRRPLIGYFLILISAIIPLALIMPDSGPYLGFRFAGMLYPILILLALNPLDKGYFFVTRTKKIFFCIAYAHSIVMAILLLIFGHFIYAGNMKVYKILGKLEPEYVILKDNATWGSIEDLYYKKKFLQVTDESKTLALLKRLRHNGVKRVAIVQTTLLKEKVKPEIYGYTILKKSSNELLRVYVLELE